EPAVVDPAPAVPAVVAPSSHSIEIHGFVSEGGFWSTDNDYIGKSSRGSLELFEVGLNVSTEVADRLRVGVQLFARNDGAFDDLSPRVDWAFLDYQWKPWLGLRAGIIKMPFGLYNEYTDIDSARLPILMPQSIYSIRERDVLISHRGFSIYGNRELGSAGDLEYQAWLGALIIPENATTVSGATLDSIDDKYVAGVQAFWHPPVDGLRVGGTYVRTSIDFNLTFTPESIATLVMLGLEPPGYDGKVSVFEHPEQLVIGSVEYARGDWLLAAEYARAFTHTRTTIPALIPTSDTDAESFYAMAAYRLSERFETGLYYADGYADVHDRHGHDPKYLQNYQAFQHDLTVSLRYDVNDHWLWKAEVHGIDGALGISTIDTPNPVQFWALFLVRTTVTF
ncbi:MAG TPA: hypothetical protein VGO00_18870, partial [Kofleriaceae bacterium]|nr:hypothetical protein [Kofleriaceae bacterium]